MTEFLRCAKEHIYYVYFLQSSSRRALYTGMTSNLHRRVYQHKTKEFRGFTFDYDSVRLVYWESYDDHHSMGAPPLPRFLRLGWVFSRKATEKMEKRKEVEALTRRPSRVPKY